MRDGCTFQVAAIELDGKLYGASASLAPVLQAAFPIEADRKRWKLRATFLQTARYVLAMNLNFTYEGTYAGTSWLDSNNDSSKDLYSCQWLSLIMQGYWIVVKACLPVMMLLQRLQFISYPAKSTSSSPLHCFPPTSGQPT